MSETIPPTKREAIRRILFFDLLLRTGIPALLILVFSFMLSNDPHKGEWLIMLMIVLITGTALSGVAGLISLLMVALKKSS